MKKNGHGGFSDPCRKEGAVKKVIEFYDNFIGVESLIRIDIMIYLFEYSGVYWL